MILRRSLAAALPLSLLLLSGFVGRATEAAPQSPAGEVAHWSFQAVKRPPVPAVREGAWLRTPIDAFVLAALEKENLKPAPPADRHTLLRRLYLDLLGLPPSPEEQKAFLNDSSPEAYERLVERLLASPHYGPRWARFWLDVARYAETNGYERDGTKPNAWRYRDYVIDAFNRDKPFDRFLTEQLAGDEVEGSDAETQIATTFLRLGTWDDEPAEPMMDRYDQLDDVLGTTATAFLGLTLRCARCHDHKFEPFTQVDYSRMLAVFEPLKRPQDGRTDLDRPVGTEAELAEFRHRQQEVNSRTASLHQQLAKIDKPILEKLLTAAIADKKAGKQPVVPPEAIQAFQTESEKRSAEQRQLVATFGGQVEDLIRLAAPEQRQRRAELKKQIAAALYTDIPQPRRAYIWYEEGPQAPPTRVFHRGDPSRPGKEVTPGLPAVLVKQQPDPPRPTKKTTGRRLWLARWLTRPDNPLTARVFVNRIWQQHFGEGLVPTENDFGVMGQAPTHPELLDWLAAEFMARGWSVKELHRLMVLSNAYRMASSPNPAAAKTDPDGALLWRWRQRRLPAEAVRDSMLAVSGRLNPQMGGPSVYPPLPRAVLEGQSRPGDGWGKSDERQVARRSVYVFVKRSLAVPELELLDSPDTTCSCEQRPVSTTGPQALTFLNGAFVHEQARHFAARLRREAGEDAAAQVRRAFELALCRPPRAEELQAATAFLERHQRLIESEQKADGRQKALEAFCLVVLNTNEFAYLN